METRHSNAIEICARFIEISFNVSFILVEWMEGCVFMADSGDSEL